MPKHLLMVKRHGGLEPDAMAGEEAYKWLSKVRDGEYVVVEVKDTARKSYKQLRYAFSLLHMAWDSSEALQKWAGNFEVFREEVLSSWATATRWFARTARSVNTRTLWLWLAGWAMSSSTSSSTVCSISSTRRSVCRSVK